jgi:hypothetical protein
MGGCYGLTVLGEGVQWPCSCSLFSVKNDEKLVPGKNLSIPVLVLALPFYNLQHAV